MERAQVERSAEPALLVIAELEKLGVAGWSIAAERGTRRYLAGHGPANERDLARWAGIPLRDVRRGLEAIAPDYASFGSTVAPALRVGEFHFASVTSH